MGKVEFVRARDTDACEQPEVRQSADGVPPAGLFATHRAPPHRRRHPAPPPHRRPPVHRRERPAPGDRMPTVTETVISGFASCTDALCDGYAQQPVEVVQELIEFSYGDGGAGQDGTMFGAAIARLTEKSVLRYRAA